MKYVIVSTPRSGWFAGELEGIVEAQHATGVVLTHARRLLNVVPEELYRLVAGWSHPPRMESCLPLPRIQLTAVNEIIDCDEGVRASIEQASAHRELNRHLYAEENG